MKKLIFLILIITVLFIPLTVLATTTPSVDASEKVYDHAKLFTSDEKEDLYYKINRAIKETNLDIVVVTINTNNKNSAMEYADDFFDYNDFGINSSRDGILLLIDMDTRELWISTSGEAQILFDDMRIGYILNDVYPDATLSNWYLVADTFIDDVKEFYNKGIPESNKDYTIDKNGNVVRIKSVNWSLSIFGALAIAGVTIAIMISKHKMIVAAKYANDYMDKNNVKLYAPIDQFLTTFTTSTVISRDSGGIGGGGRSGGSSTHRSSSGRSHGGGGRRF